MPEDFYAGDKPLYVQRASRKAWRCSRPMAGCRRTGPTTVFKVLSQIHGNIRDKAIDLSKTFTGEFVEAANQRYP